MIIKKILVYTDFSEFSIKAYSYALNLAFSYNAEVHIVNLLTVNKDECEENNNILEFRKEVLSAEEELNRFVNKIQSIKTEVFDKVITGNNFSEIIKYGESINADLLVISFEFPIPNSVNTALQVNTKIPVININRSGKPIPFQSYLKSMAFTEENYLY